MKDSEREWRKAYREANRDKANNYSKNYYKNNKKRLIQNVIRRRKERRKTDINFKIEDLLRNKLWTLIKKNNKHKSALILLGCSVEEFNQFIKEQFKPEMTWENHGLIWELDHIKPCSSFDLINIEQQKECFHYTNFQPLFKTTEIAESFGYNNEIGNRNKYKSQYIYNCTNI